VYEEEEEEDEEDDPDQQHISLFLNFGCIIGKYK
jgi:hypothetical protein